MTELPEARLVRVETKQEAHEKSDDERYGRIDANLEKIALSVQSFGDRLDKGFTRVHERVDEEASKARHSLANEIGKVNGAITQAKQEAAAATAELEGDVRELERKGGSYVQQALIFALGIALSSIAYLIVYGPPWSKAAAAGGN